MFLLFTNSKSTILKIIFFPFFGFHWYSKLLPKYCLSKPIFSCKVVPKLSCVIGFISFEINLFKEIGKGDIILGNFIFISAPSSNKLKNLSFIIEEFLEAPRVLLILKSKTSVPLKMFLIPLVTPSPIPIFWIFEWDKSRSIPRENLSFGVKKIEEINVLSDLGSYVMLGYLKLPNELKYLYVNVLSLSLYQSPILINMGSVMALFLYFNFSFELILNLS